MSGTGISYIPPVLAIGALVFSTVIGIVSGYSPARRAMNLSALDAIRSE
jgi:ABC-type antimicrobial peptide transport system permease subunit